MQKEIVTYCVLDVDILTLACLKFRESLIKAGNVCPFSEACTIASSCNKLFRRNFLKPDTIGLIPRHGYRYRDKQSKIAIEWLIWEEKVRGINILHAAKGKEMVLGGLSVDGYCAETNQVFEMMGCFYHGCTKCFKNDRDKPVYNNGDETMNLRYENTRSKIVHLNQLGYEVIQQFFDEDSSDLEWFSDSSSGNVDFNFFIDEYRKKHVRVQNYVNIVDIYSHEQFRRHFRLSRTTAELCDLENANVLPTHTYGREKVCTRKAFYMSVWYLANEETYRQISDRFDVSESAAWLIIRNVVDYLVTKSNTVIKWPTEEEAMIIEQEFSEKQA
ncbi:hypothetical protein PPYR_02647 [Photinus pyralis]|uniref:Transposase Helix-turn-helix domain-containing protein n=1 Tax=Photinus pyralis TaxID=7054 RepID=A0A5N4B7U0_PHOPY|nr:hypothetical protein PPYR_02647 [Photinus pyralis]